VLLNAAWTSNREDGFLLGAGVGVTQVGSSLNGSRMIRRPGSTNGTTLSISDSISDTGASIGLKAGYIYAFDGGFTLGLLGNFIYPTLTLRRFNLPSEEALEDGNAFEVVEKSKGEFSASSAGLLIGFTF
jgi:hypothetical protein